MPQLLSAFVNFSFLKLFLFGKRFSSQKQNKFEWSKFWKFVDRVLIILVTRYIKSSWWFGLVIGTFVGVCSKRIKILINWRARFESGYQKSRVTCLVRMTWRSCKHVTFQKIIKKFQQFYVLQGFEFLLIIETDGCSTRIDCPVVVTLWNDFLFFITWQCLWPHILPLPGPD